MDEIGGSINGCNQLYDDFDVCAWLDININEEDEHVYLSSLFFICSRRAETQNFVEERDDVYRTVGESR